MWRWILATSFLITFSTGTSFITVPFALTLAGFWPSLFAIVIAGIYLLITGLYYLEATLALTEGANVYSISKRHTPGFGTWFNSIIFFLVNYGYLFLFFYLALPILSELLFIAHIPWPQLLANLLFVIIFGSSLCLGLKWTLCLNFVLMLFMGVIFFLTITGEIQILPSKLPSSFEIGFLALAFPSLLSALYFQTMIPTMASFLKQDLRALKSAIITSVCICWAIFICWTSIVIATKASASFENLSTGLSFGELSRVPGFGRWLPTLLLLSAATSILGQGAILSDFILDLFRNSRKFALSRRLKHRVLLVCFLFLPPLVAPLIQSNFFYAFLRLLTDIGGLYLCGLLPIWWIWSLRYDDRDKVPHLVMGGKSLLLFMTVLSFFIFYLVGLEFIYQSA